MMEIHETWNEGLQQRFYSVRLDNGREIGGYDTREAAEAAGRFVMSKAGNPAPVAHPTKDREKCERQAAHSIHLLEILERSIDDWREEDLPDGLEMAIMDLADWRLLHVRELLESFYEQLRNIKLEREMKHGGRTSQNGRV
jgi:hypothetical protein